MTKPNDGGPAFPQTIQANPGEYAYAPPGMTLRQWYAGQAMMGILAYPGKTTLDGLGVNEAPDLASAARSYADALIAELDKE